MKGAVNSFSRRPVWLYQMSIIDCIPGDCACDGAEDGQQGPLSAPLMGFSLKECCMGGCSCRKPVRQNMGKNTGKVIFGCYGFVPGLFKRQQGFAP